MTRKKGKHEQAARGWLSRIALPHRVGGRDVVFALVTGLLWWGAIHARSFTIEPACRGPEARTACSRESVPAIDRIALGMENGDADGFSYATQNISGYLAIGGPILWGAFRAVTAVVSPAVAAAEVGADLLLLAQASTLNGLLNEISHAALRRPRPFVYSDPVTRGSDPSHYTSFYSGHTSFAALAGLSLLLMLLARQAPPWLLALSFASWQTLTVATGYFRVMAGRHFLTDVLAATLIGSAVAWSVFMAHKPRS